MSHFGIGRPLAVQQPSMAWRTGTEASTPSEVAPLNFGPVALLLQSSHGPGLYAAFVAHALWDTDYPQDIWAFQKTNELKLPDGDSPVEPPVNEWDPVNPPQKTVAQYVPYRDLEIPINIYWGGTTMALGPLIYRSNLPRGDKRANEAFFEAKSYDEALPYFDLAIAFLNANVALPFDLFKFPGQEFSISQGALPVPKEGEDVLVCSECLLDSEFKVVNITARITSVHQNGCLFSITPTPTDQPFLPIRKGYSGSPVIKKSTINGKTQIEYLGYIVASASDKQTGIVARADAALQHLAKYCSSLGLSIASSEVVGQFQWLITKAGTSFYQYPNDPFDQ